MGNGLSGEPRISAGFRQLLDFHHGVGTSHAAQWNVMLSTQLSNQQVELKPFCPTCFVFCECCAPICDSCTLFLAPLT